MRNGRGRAIDPSRLPGPQRAWNLLLDSDEEKVVRLAAFGSTLDGRHGGRYFRLTLGHILEFLEAYVEHYWESLRVEESKDPALGYLILTAKAKRGGAVAPQ